MVHIKKSLRNKNGREKIHSMPMMQVNFCSCCSVTTSCLTLLFCDPMDCSLPGSSVRRIFQARILERVAVSFSRKELNLLPDPGVEPGSPALQAVFTV